MVFVKGGKTENVWFYEMLKDGYSLDQKRDFIDGKGDTPDIVQKFKSRQTSEQSIIVSFERIQSSDYSLSVSAYKEIEQQDMNYEDPKETIDKLMKQEEEICNELNELKKMMS